MVQGGGALFKWRGVAQGRGREVFFVCIVLEKRVIIGSSHCWKMMVGGSFLCPPLGPGGGQSESGSQMGEERRKCRRAIWDEGAEGVHKGYFHIPAGMVVRGGRR